METGSVSRGFVIFSISMFYTESATRATDDFPTLESLPEANSKYKQNVTEKYEKGRILPSPAVRTKQQIFRLSDYKAIDCRACQVHIMFALIVSYSCF